MILMYKMCSMFLYLQMKLNSQSSGYKAMNIGICCRGTWDVDGRTETEESLNSGVEGEWRLQREVEGISREFAMRQWEDSGRSEEGGEGDLRKGRV
jgi:hypothetical protein